MTPQTAKRKKWEERLTYLIEVKAGCTTSDAQALIEAEERRVNKLYEEDNTPEEAANEILR